MEAPEKYHVTLTPVNYKKGILNNKESNSKNYSKSIPFDDYGYSKERKLNSI